jgi:hypothetical protein
VDRELKLFPPKHSFLRHCGVYENPDAIDYIATWINDKRAEGRHLFVGDEVYRLRTVNAAELPARVAPADHPLYKLFGDPWEKLSRQIPIR